MNATEDAFRVAEYFKTKLEYARSTIDEQAERIQALCEEIDEIKGAHVQDLRTLNDRLDRLKRAKRETDQDADHEVAELKRDNDRLLADEAAQRARADGLAVELYAARTMFERVKSEIGRIDGWGPLPKTPEGVFEYLARIPANARWYRLGSDTREEKTPSCT